MVVPIRAPSAPEKRRSGARFWGRRQEPDRDRTILARMTLPAASHARDLTDEQWVLIGPFLPKLARRTDGRGAHGGRWCGAQRHLVDLPDRRPMGRPPGPLSLLSNVPPAVSAVGWRSPIAADSRRGSQSRGPRRTKSPWATQPSRSGLSSRSLCVSSGTTPTSRTPGCRPGPPRRGTDRPAPQNTNIADPKTVARCVATDGGGR